ncbi:glycosyltransferase family 1 protein [Duncaniella muris]|uniref:glycosyltransferase family 4 protein n=1 Tax=Duncaniella muris TaxID=2094150 RepID=UPI0025A99A7F|nr:glycosyltransferase family 1 protein [Duncaniella muris]
MDKEKSVLYNLAATQPMSGTMRHGGGIYGEIVLRKIIELRRNVTVAYDSRCWLNPEMIALCENNSVELVDISQCGFQSVIDSRRIDIFYSPQPLDELYRLENCELVVTIHDLRSIELTLDRKMFWRYKMQLSMQLKNLLEILSPSFIRRHRYRKNENFIRKPNLRFAVVSNHSLGSVNLFFPESIEKDIPVFYSPSTSLDLVDSRKEAPDFYLLVSANRWEKNCLRAIMALDQLFSEGRLPGKRVVITGVKSADYFRYKIKNPGFFDFRGYVSDEELNQLYHDAYCFIYPSLNEGFGYPPLEAMRYGVPVLASPFSSISEVCGDAVLYFNPFSLDEIKIRIIQLENKVLYERQRAKSLERYEFITACQKEDLEKFVRFIYNGPLI